MTTFSPFLHASRQKADSIMCHGYREAGLKAIVSKAFIEALADEIGGDDGKNIRRCIDEGGSQSLLGCPVEIVETPLKTCRFVPADDTYPKGSTWYLLEAPGRKYDGRAVWRNMPVDSCGDDTHCVVQLSVDCTMIATVRKEQLIPIPECCPACGYNWLREVCFNGICNPLRDHGMSSLHAIHCPNCKRLLFAPTRSCDHGRLEALRMQATRESIIRCKDCDGIYSISEDVLIRHPLSYVQPVLDSFAETVTRRSRG